MAGPQPCVTLRPLGALLQAQRTQEARARFHVIEADSPVRPRTGRCAMMDHLTAIIASNCLCRHFQELYAACRRCDFATVVISIRMRHSF